METVFFFFFLLFPPCAIWRKFPKKRLGFLLSRGRVAWSQWFPFSLRNSPLNHKWVESGGLRCLTRRFKSYFFFFQVTSFFPIRERFFEVPAPAGPISFRTWRCWKANVSSHPFLFLKIDWNRPRSVDQWTGVDYRDFFSLNSRKPTPFPLFLDLRGGAEALRLDRPNFLFWFWVSLIFPPPPCSGFFFSSFCLRFPHPPRSFFRVPFQLG